MPLLIFLNWVLSNPVCKHQWTSGNQLLHEHVSRPAWQTVGVRVRRLPLCLVNYSANKQPTTSPIGYNIQHPRPCMCMWCRLVDLNLRLISRIVAKTTSEHKGTFLWVSNIMSNNEIHHRISDHLKCGNGHMKSTLRCTLTEGSCSLRCQTLLALTFRDTALYVIASTIC